MLNPELTHPAIDSPETLAKALRIAYRQRLLKFPRTITLYNALPIFQAV